MKKKVLCPVCRGRLFDADSGLELDLRPVQQEAEIRNAVYVKCSKCGKVCAASFGSAKHPTEGSVVPVTALLDSPPIPLEIKLNIVYSVQS